MAERKQGNQKTRRIYGPCALIFSSTETGTWRITRPRIDDEACICCGACEKYCPTEVVSVRKEGSSHGEGPASKVDIDMTYCKGCGICANVCPKDAIDMIDEREA